MKIFLSAEYEPLLWNEDIDAQVLTVFWTIITTFCPFAPWFPGIPGIP